MADSNFKFNLDALLNLKPGDTSELERYVKGLSSMLSIDAKNVNLRAAQSSAITAQTDAVKGVMKSISGIISSSLPKGNTISKLESSASSVNKLVDALASVPKALGGNATRSVQAASTNIDKLVGILDALPQTVGSITTSVKELKRATDGLKTAADRASTASSSGSAPPPRRPAGGTAGGNANVPPPPGSGGGTGGGGDQGGRGRFNDAINRFIDRLNGLSRAIEDASKSITASAKSASDSAAAAASNVSSAGRQGAPVVVQQAAADPFSYSPSNVRETVSKLRRRAVQKPHGDIKDSDLTELNTVLSQIITEAVKNPRAQFSSTLDTLKNKLPAGLKAYAEDLRAVFTDTTASVAERKNAFETLSKLLKNEIRSDRGTREHNEEFRTAWKRLQNSVTLALSESLLDKVRSAKAALDQAVAEGAPKNKISRLQNDYLEATTQLTKSVKQGAFTQAGLPKKASQNPFIDANGIVLPGVEALNEPLGRGLSKVGQEWKNWLQTIVNGTEKEFQKLRDFLNLASKDRVKAAQELYGREIKREDLNAARDVQSAAGLIIENGPNEREVAAQLRSFFSKALRQATEGKVPTSLSAAAQQTQISNLASTKRGGANAGAQAVERALFKRSDSGELLKRDFVDIEALSKKIYTTLVNYNLPIDEMDTAIQSVIANLRSIKGLDPFDQAQLSRIVDTYKAIARERAKSDSAKAPGAQPFALFGADAAKGLTAEVLKSLQGVQALRQPAQIVEKIFDNLRGSASDVRKQVALLEQELKAAQSAKIANVDAESLKAALTAIRQINRAIDKNTSAPGTTREQAFTQLGRVIAEKRAELQSKLASGSKAGDINFSFSVPDAATGGLKKLDLTIKKTTDSYGQLAVVARQAGSVLASRTDLQTAIRRVALWGTASGLLYGALSVLRSGLTTITEVETGVIKVGKVIQKSIADFSSFRREVLDTANAITATFGTSIESVLQTMFTFAQQGLELPDVSAASQVTALAENVTSLDAPKAAEALTAAFQQFGFEVAQSERILDSWNEVANRTAVTEDVLADAVKKAGTAARGAGVDFDSFNGLVSAIGSATRQSGKEIGTSLRFIFQRLTRPAAASALRQVGVDASDAAGNFRGFLPIITDLSRVWGTLSQSQKLAIAQSAAGIRQYNTFLVIMERFDQFVKAAAISTESQGSAMRENQEVMKSAVKQWSLFKEQVKQTAVQLGGVFLPVAKTLLGGITSLVQGFNALPSALQGIVGGFGLLGVAALKVGDRLDGVLTTLTTLPTASTGFVSAIAAGLRTVGAGTALDDLSDSMRAFVADNPLRRATVQVGDFSKGAAKALTEASGSGALATTIFANLGDRSLAAGTKMSKFSLAVRAVDANTGKAALGVADMNSFFGKLGLTVARLGQNFGGLAVAAVTAIPGIKQLFGKITASAGAATIANLGFAASLGGFVALASVVGVALYGVHQAYTKITESGIETADKMKKPIAALEEQLSVARKAQLELQSFALAQKKIDAAQAASPAQAAKERERGTYRPPELEALKLAKSQESALSSLGSAAIDAISGFDSLGNAIVKTDASLAGFNSTAVTSLATAVAIKKTQAAAAVAAELVGGAWYQSARIVDKYNEAVSRLRTGLKTYSSLVGTLPDLGVINKSESTRDFRRSIADASKEVTKYGAQLKVAEFRLKALVESYDKDTPAEFFQTLKDSEGGQKVLAAMADLANSRLRPALGKVADQSDILNKLLLKTKTRLKEVGDIGEVTLAKFAAKKVDPIPLDASNVELLADKIRSGAKDFENAFAVFRLPGENKLSQARLLIDREGELIVERFNRQGRLVRTAASEFINSGALDIKVLSPGRLAKVVGEEIDKVKKVVTGAGAGTQFSGQVNLGARLDLDLTPQQRVARTLPDLFRTAAKAQRDYSTALKNFNEVTKNSSQATAGLSANLQKAAADLNVSSFVLRLATDVQQLGIEAEKAANRLQTADIGRSVEDFLASFAVGAERGVVQSRNFKPSATTGELTATQKFNRDFGKQIDKLTSDTEGTKNQATQLKAIQRLGADIPQLFSQFRSSLGKLGTPDDIVNLVKNIQSGNDAKSSLEKTLQSKAFQQRNESIKLAGRMAVASEKTARGVDYLAKKAGADKKAADATKEEVFGKRLEQQTTAATAAAIKEAYALRAPKPEKAVVETKSRDSLALRTTEEITQTVSRLVNQAASSGDLSEGTILRIVETLKTESATAVKTARETLISSLAPSSKGYSVTLAGSAQQDRDRLQAQQRAQAAAAGLEAAQTASSFASSPAAVNAIRRALEDAIDLRTRQQPTAQGTTKVVNFEQTVAAAQQKLLEMKESVAKVARDNAALSKVLDSFKTEVLSSSFSVQKFASTLETSLRTIKSQLSSRDIDRRLSGPLAGALRGIVTSSPDVGKAQEDLSPIERLQKTFGGVFRAVEDFQSVIRPESLRVLKSLGVEITRNEERLASVRRDKTDVGVRASLAIAGALDKEKAIRDRLVRVIQYSNAEIGKFAESARRLIILEDVKKKIEGLVASLEIASRISFDTTSIDKALGRSAFSVQPAQFGQKSSDLNRFQQREEQLKAQLDQGVTADQYRSIQNELAKIQFDKKETVNTEQQNKEREKLSAEINAGKQALQTLAEAERRGAPVGNLIEVLKSELASAGDVTESGGKKYFRGLPSLQNLSAEISKLQEGNTRATLENQRKITLGPLEELTKTTNATLAEIQKNTAAFTAFADSKRPSGKIEGSFFDEAVKAISGSSDPLVSSFDKVTTSASGAAEALDKLIKAIPEIIANALKGTVNDSKSPFGGPGINETPKFASGGQVVGRSGIDNVPAMLTSGEFVLPRTAVRSLSTSYGAGALQALRRGRLPGWAEGGEVSWESWLKDLELLRRKQGLTAGATRVIDGSAILAPGEGVAGTRTFSDPQGPGPVPDSALLSSGFSYKASAYPGGGYSDKGQSGSAFIGVSKGGRVILSDSADSSLFDSSNVAVPPRDVSGSTYKALKGAVDATRTDYKDYQTAIRKGFTSLEEYKAAQAAQTIDSSGESKIIDVLSNTALQEYAAEKSTRLESLASSSSQRVSPIDPSKASSTFTTSGIDALEKVLAQNNAIVDKAREYAGLTDRGIDSNPKLRGLYEQAIAAGTLARSITLPDHDPSKGAFISLNGVRYKVSYADAQKVKFILQNTNSELLKLQKSQSKFEENPTLSRLATANVSSGGIDPISQREDFMSSLLRRIVGSAGLGIVAGGNQLSDTYAKNGVDPGSLGGVLRNVGVIGKSIVTAPFKAAEGVGTLAAKTGVEFDLSSKEKALNTLTNASLLGLTSAGTFQAGAGLFALTKSAVNAPISLAQSFSELPTSIGGPNVLGAAGQTATRQGLFSRLAKKISDFRNRTQKVSPISYNEAAFADTAQAVAPVRTPTANLTGASSAGEISYLEAISKAPPELLRKLGESGAAAEAKHAAAQAAAIKYTGPTTTVAEGFVVPKRAAAMFEVTPRGRVVGGFSFEKARALGLSKAEVNAAAEAYHAYGNARHAARAAAENAAANKALQEVAAQNAGFGAVSPPAGALGKTGAYKAPAAKPVIPVAPPISPSNLALRAFEKAAFEAGGRRGIQSLGEAARVDLLTKYMSEARGGFNAQSAARILGYGRSRTGLEAFYKSDIFEKALQAANKAAKFATGGRIMGNGGPRADDIPIMASAGEYVVNARAAKSLGLARLEYMNKVGHLPRFADGGLVGPSSSDGFGIDTESISRAISSAIDEAASRFVERVGSLELQLKAPSAEELTLKAPDLSGYSSSGGPGAARLGAVEGSIDVLRADMQTLSQGMSNTIEVLKSESLTELNERISNVLNELRAEVDTRLFSQISEVRSEMSSVEAIARQASSSASDALSRSMR